jgi:hypothetical protein
MPGVIVEVRCPNCDSPAVDREHGIGRLIAGILCFVGIGIPIFVYTTWRPHRLGDHMKCRLCRTTFALAAQHVNFPRGTSASTVPDTELKTAASPILLLVVALSGALGLALAGVVASSVSSLLSSSPSAPTTIAGVQSQTPSATAIAGGLSTPTAKTAEFSPFWVRNHEITDMWSGPEGQATAVSFGKTSAQFCAFLVVQPQDNARLYVLNPYSNDYFWIDQKSVGPADRPESQPGRRAPDQNSGSTCQVSVERRRSGGDRQHLRDAVSGLAVPHDESSLQLAA